MRSKFLIFSGNFNENLYSQNFSHPFIQASPQKHIFSTVSKPFLHKQIQINSYKYSPSIPKGKTLRFVTQNEIIYSKEKPNTISRNISSEKLNICVFRICLCGKISYKKNKICFKRTNCVGEFYFLLVK